MKRGRAAARFAPAVAVAFAVLAGALVPLTAALVPVAGGSKASAAAAGYAFGPAPIAPAGSLREAATVTIVVTAHDPSGAPAPDSQIFLSLASTASPAGSAAVDGIPLRSGPQLFAADRNGQVVVSYTTAAPECAPVGFGGCPSGGYPTSGVDTITAGNSANPTVIGTDSYDYTPSAALNPDQYFFGPSPIASPASLLPGQQVPVTLAVLTAAGQPEPATQVYVSQSSSGGGGTVTVQSPACGSVQLSTHPSACTTDADGQLHMTYTAAGAASSGTGAPTSGKDAITVQNAPVNPTEIATNTYDYANPVYAFTTTPLAAPGTLGSSQSVSFSVTATDASGQTLVNAPVFLALAAAPVGRADATGATPSENNPTGGSALTTTPTPFETDNNGRIVVTFHTPVSAPSGASNPRRDVITAQNAATNPTATTTDTYTYAPSAYVFAPAPVAPAGRVGAGQSVQVSLMVTAPPSTQAQPGATVFLSFEPAPGGGRARVGATQLTSTPTAFTADGSGRVVITYSAPSPYPTGGPAGTDAVIAQDAAESPTYGSADVYDLGSATNANGAQGYWLVARDGGIFTFGSAGFFGSHGATPLNAPITSMAATPDGRGYWFVGADGGIFTYGDAGFFGSTGAMSLAAPVVGMATTPDGAGYWLVGSDGGIFNFGDAHFYGAASAIASTASTRIVGMAATPDGNGYWEVGANGAVYPFGDAHAFGGANGTHLNSPIVAMASTATGDGYWLVGSDGGIFTYGDAFFYGSTGNLHLVAPIVGMTATPNGAGYRFVAADGGLFTYGNASFQGSMGGQPLNQPVVGMAGS